jgi:hypothetical protein
MRRTPATELSLRHLRSEGWLVDVCERWIPSGDGGQVRRDLFGLIDLVALRGSVTMGVQTTSNSNVNARLSKIGDGEHAEQLAALTAAGWQVVVHGWRKSTREGHACQHDKRCACRWTLHRCITVGGPS